MTPALLRIEELGYRYGDRTAVDRVSLSIEKGELFGLLGPNGAGKTTLISCICGLLPDPSGSMAFAGAEFRPARDRERHAAIGLVPQDLALYDELAARENLELLGRLQGVAKDRLAKAVERGIEIAGLADRANDRVASFSGGMKRRLNLAVGDLHEPELQLLDEPTVGVDPQSRNHVFQCLRSLRERGRTMIYTTHYMEEAQRLCDRVAIMHEGKILPVDTPEGLAEAAGSPGADLETVFLKLTGTRLRDEP
ncbi:MAG: hypothetical protein Fur0037_21530 [Planctomycetota bacterium]